MTSPRSAHRRSLRGLSATLLLLALLLAVCGGDEEAPPPADIPAPDTILEGAAARMQQVQSFHFVLDHENGATQIVGGIDMTSAEGDLVAPDQMQATIEGSLGPLDFDTGLVILGEDAWLQNPVTQRWDSEDITIDQVFDPREGVVALMHAARSPRVTAIEEVDGADSYRIEATLDSGDLTLLPGDPQPGREVPTTAWIGVDDQLVRKVELRGPVASGESDDLVRRLTLSRFDEDVSIAPPE